MLWLHSFIQRGRKITMPVTLRSHQVIHQRGLFKTTGGHPFKLLHSQSKCIKGAGASEKDLSTCSLLRECRTNSSLHYNNVIQWTFWMREDLIFSVLIVGEGTKCKRFDQIDLLSRSSDGAWTSLSQASVGCAGNLCSLICVIVRGERQNESSIIHSGYIQQVIVCCCIMSAPEKRFIRLDVWQE